MKKHKKIGLTNKLIYKDKSFYSLVAAMMIPIACQNMITIGVNVADTMMLGYVGETQLSASALASQYVNMYQTFCMGISMGASVLTARYYGMKEFRSLRISITIMFRLVIIFACVFAALSAFAPGMIMRMYSSDEAVVQEGINYLGYATPAFFFYGLSQASTVIMRSMKKVKIPLITSIGAFCLNVLGNYIFIFGKLGFAEMGIAGASLATLIVRIFECGINFGYLIFIENEVKYRFRDLFIRTDNLIKEYIRIGLPVFASDAVAAIGNNVVMMIIGRMGVSFVAANAIVAVVERLCTAMSSGVGQASAMVTGNTLGTGEIEEVKKQGYAFLGIGMFLGAISAILVLLIRNPIIILYSLSENTADITAQLLNAAAVIVFFQSIASILTKGVIRGGGDTKILMVADNIFLWIVSIPLGYLCSMISGVPPFFVYTGLKVDNICKTIWGIKRLNSDKWIKKINIAS